MTVNIIIKKNASKVSVIWSSPKELISVQIINLDFRLQKIQLKLIRIHEKRKRFRHYCWNVLHKTYLIKFKFENYVKFEKQIFCTNYHTLTGNITDMPTLSR